MTEEKDYAEEIRELTEKIEAEPKNAEYYMERGNYYSMIDKYNEALSDYTKIIQFEPHNSNAYSERGDCHYFIEQYSEAIDDYTKSIEFKPKNSDAYSGRGSCYKELEQYQDAIKDLDKAIEFGPEDFFAYSERGDCYFQLEQYEAAIKDFDKTIELDPEEGNHYSARGFCYNFMEEYSKAISDYTKAIELGYKDGSLYLGRGICYYFTDQYEKGIEDFNKAIQLVEEKSYAYSGRGDCYYGLDKYEKAIQDYREAINNDPENDDAYSGRAYCYFAIDRYKEAIRDYKTAIRLNSEDSEIYYQLGDCYVFLGDDLRAIQNYTKHIEMNSEDVNGYLSRGLCYSFLDNYKKALKDFNECIRLSPRSALPYFLRSECFCKTNNEKKALEDLVSFRQKDEGGQDKLHISIFSAKGQYGKELGNIVADSSVSFMLKAMEILLDLKKLGFYNENYAKLANFLDHFGLPEFCSIQRNEEFINQIFQHYPDFKGSLEQIYYRDGKDIFIIQCKLSILADLSDKFRGKVKVFPKKGKSVKIEKTFNQQADFMSLYYSINKALQEKNLKIIEKKEQEKVQARIDERNKVIADLSHSIKNLISTVIDPLETIKDSDGDKDPIIDNALRGANLIREIVNAMNLSYKGSIDDFYYDAAHNTGKEAMDFETIILESLKYSVGHMFDGKYFANFLRKYFPERNIFKEAKERWSNTSQAAEPEALNSFLSQYFFDMKLNISGAADFVMGNEKGSAIKLLILFQEVIFNAVKYSAFVDKDKRFLHITLSEDNEHIAIKVENRYKKTVKTKSSGLGTVIIKNFAELLQSKPVIDTNNDIYSIEIRFANFWKGESA